MSKFKVGDTVYAAKAKDDGTIDTDHRFGYNSRMDVFAQGNIKGEVAAIDGDEIYVRTPNGTWSYAEHGELRKTPRITKPRAERTQKVLAKAPKKVYAVVKGSRVYATQTREEARELKASLGGKAKGAVIIAYALVEEIR